MSFVLLSVHWCACFDITRYSYLLEDGRNTANMLELLHKRVVALGHQHVIFVLQFVFQDLARMSGLKAIPCAHT